MRRRSFLALMAGTMVSGAARAQSSEFTQALGELTQGAVVKPERVKLRVPRLADNGHSVPLEVAVESPMTAADHVRTITLLSERNPRPVMATFHFGPHSGRAHVSTRVRFNGTQRVLAVAQLSDGSFVSASAQVEVTESACLDMS